MTKTITIEYESDNAVFHCDHVTLTNSLCVKQLKDVLELFAQYGGIANEQPIKDCDSDYHKVTCTDLQEHRLRLSLDVLLRGFIGRQESVYDIAIRKTRSCTMPKWEYKVVYATTTARGPSVPIGIGTRLGEPARFDPAVDYERQLNDLGLQEWELVGVSRDAITDKWLFYLKRPKP